MLDIQIFLQKVLQIADVLNDYWYEKVMLIIVIDENQ